MTSESRQISLRLALSATPSDTPAHGIIKDAEIFETYLHSGAGVKKSNSSWHIRHQSLAYAIDSVSLGTPSAQIVSRASIFEEYQTSPDN